MTPSPDRPLQHCPWLTAPETRVLLADLTETGAACRFVGGCVRDSLLDPLLDEVDLDIATQELPEAVIARLRAKGYKVLPTGLRHGTVTVLAGTRSYEITTLRRDVRTFGRHAEVAFSLDFVEDAARRDFTINALGCDADGRLLDPFAGRADLAAGKIRFVGEPVRRIREDYLRILRFFRFFARFAKGEPDPASLAACAAEAEGIDRLSGERVRAEFLKLLVSVRAVDAVAAMMSAGVASRIVRQPLALANLERLARLAPESDGLLRMGALLRTSALPSLNAEFPVERLRLSTREASRLDAMLKGALPDLNAPRHAHERLVLAEGIDAWTDRLRLGAAIVDAPAERLRELEHALRSWPKPEFPLAGSDVLDLGVPQGPEVGKLLLSLRRWWEEASFIPDRAACLAELRARWAASHCASATFSPRG